MSNNGHGSSTRKRFSGDDNSVPAEYKNAETMSSCSLSCPALFRMVRPQWHWKRSCGGSLWIEIHEKRDDGRFHRTIETCVLPAFSQKVRTCRRKSEVQCFAWMSTWSLRKPTIMSATVGAGSFMMCAWRSRTSSPGCPPDRWSHRTFAVDELEERV